MMLRALLSCVALLLAGCAAPALPQGGDADAAAVLPAPSAAAATAWLREQWRGEEEIVLLEETVTIAAAFSEGPDACVPACEGEVVTPGEVLVPAGTGTVEVVAELVEGGALPPGAGVRFVYDSGRGGPSEREVLTPGTPFVIEVYRDMWDAPFQPHTHWWFGFFGFVEPAGALPPTELRVRVVAVRDASIALDVPEPRDPWGEKETIPLVASRAHRLQRVAAGPAAACYGACGGTWWSSDPGALVPQGTDLVRARVSWDGVMPAPTLEAWTPDDGFAQMLLVEEGPDHRVFEIEPPAEFVDSPYQTRSLWWFVVSLPPGVREGSLTLESEAIREAPPS